MAFTQWETMSCFFKGQQGKSVPTSQNLSKKKIKHLIFRRFSEDSVRTLPDIEGD